MYMYLNPEIMMKNIIYPALFLHACGAESAFKHVIGFEKRYNFSHTKKYILQINSNIYD